MNSTTFQTNTTNSIKRDGNTGIVVDDYGNEVVAWAAPYLVDDYGDAIYLSD